MAIKQSEILGLFSSPRDVEALAQERIATEARAYSDPIAQQLYRSTSNLAGGVAGMFGAQPKGVAEASKIEEIRQSVPFDAENQSQYYTQLGQQLINQGLTKAGIQALELAKQAKLDEAKAAKDATGTLGSADKKAIREASNSARSARARASQAKNLRDRYLTEAPMSGIMGSVFGSFKSFVGGQTEIDNLKKEYEGLRIADGLANLPPGAASDKDVELALSRFPGKDDNAAYIGRFLNGLYKMSVLDAEYNNFYAQYLSDNYGNSAGVEKAWLDKAETIDWEGRYGVTWDATEAGVTDEEPQEIGVGESVTIDGVTIERVN